jgi:hypothetical protein
MKTGTPATRRGIDADEMGGAGGKKFGGKKKGGPDGVFPGGPNGPGGPGGPGGLAPGGGKQFNRPEGAFEKKS